MEGTMRAWYAMGHEQMEMKTVPIPQIKRDEVLVRIKSVGICGSDIHFYKDGQIGSFVADEPIILGHECSGEIVELGSEVTNHRVGERVVVEPGIPCFHCRACRIGRYNFCEHMAFMGTPPTDGCMCEYVAWPSELVYEIPDEMSFAEAAMIEPFVVALQSIRNTGIGFSDNAVVIGDGPISIMLCQALKMISAGTIICLGHHDNKLELAKKMGATHVFNTKSTDPTEKIKELTDGLGAMYTFECAGTNETYQLSERITRDGGTVCLVGLLVHDGTPMAMSTSVMRGITYVPMIRYTNLFKEAITLLKFNRAEIMPVMTHKYSFEQSQEAYQKVVHDKNDAEKVVIEF